MSFSWKSFNLVVFLAAGLLVVSCETTPHTDSSMQAETQSQSLLFSVDEKEVIKRSSLDGCELLLNVTRRQTCIDENQGLHLPTACSATACQITAGVDANVVREAGWSSCVNKRTIINGSFGAELKDLKKFQSGSLYKKWSQTGKKAMRELIGKIEKGQPNHNKELSKAKEQLKICKKLLTPPGGN